MTRMNWERASARDRANRVPFNERERIVRSGKKRKRKRGKKYQPIQGVDFTTYRRPET